MKLDIKKMKDEDWDAVVRIYKLGMDTGIATFETEVPTWDKWDNSHLKTCRLTAWIDDQIVGWAALSPVSSRCVYGGVAEVSVYIDTNYNRRGVGTKLLKVLIVESESAGIWTLQSGIFPQNETSINLHKKLGFREIGYKERIGKRDDVWYNNILLERRSKIIGID